MLATTSDQKQLIAHDPIYDTKDGKQTMKINLSGVKYNCEIFNKQYDKEKEELTDYEIMSYDTEKKSALQITPTDTTLINYVCHPTGHEINVDISKPYLLFYEFLLDGYTQESKHTFKTGISNTRDSDCGLISVDDKKDLSVDKRRSCDSMNSGSDKETIEITNATYDKIFDDLNLDYTELSDIIEAKEISKYDLIKSYIEGNKNFDETKLLNNEKNIKNLMERLYVVYKTSATRTNDVISWHHKFYKSKKILRLFYSYIIVLIKKFIIRTKTPDENIQDVGMSKDEIEIKEKIDNDIMFGRDLKYKHKPFFEEEDSELVEGIGNSHTINIFKKSYMQKYTFNQNNKVILIGDIHGSFHTFFRIILRFHRMNILNINTLKITNDNYKIIFLGDIVDRGQYSYLILNILLPLMYNNPNNIFAIRGNHEVFVTNHKHGLLKELANLDSKNEQTTIHHLINEFFKTFPSAILLKYKIASNPFTYWLAHGGFHQYNEDITYTEPKLYNIDDKLDKQIFILGQYYYGHAMRWSDFNFNEYKDPYEGGGRTQISNENTNKFRKAYGIDYIIRGHQDLFSSFMFISKTSNDHLTKSTNMTGSIAKHKNIFHLADTNSAYEGPISILKMGSTLHKYMNVVTVSTCNDVDRPLNRDSFCILCSGSDVQNLPNLKQNKVSDDLLRTGKFSGNKDVYHKKYVKYKRKYLMAKKSKVNYYVWYICITKC